jgi:uncharacterized protein YjeT (DUF2065 family)
MINLLALILVLLVGFYLIGLAGLLLVSPARGKRFLFGFASSAFTHYFELVIRLISGVAILLYAPLMLFSGFFVVLGWVLVVTTAGLFIIPWQWHRQFAQWGVSYATRHLRLFAVASFVFGGFVLASVILGNGTGKWLRAQRQKLLTERPVQNIVHSLSPGSSP